MGRLKMEYILRYEDPEDGIVHVRHYQAQNDLQALLKMIINVDVHFTIEEMLHSLSNWTVERVRSYIVRNAGVPFELKNETTGKYIEQFMHIPKEEVQIVNW